MGDLSEKRSQQTADTSRDDVVSRGDLMLDLVRQQTVVDLAKFNDQTDFDIDVAPGIIWDDLNTFKAEQMPELEIEHIDNKCIKLTKKALDESS